MLHLFNVVIIYQNMSLKQMRNNNSESYHKRPGYLYCGATNSGIKQVLFFDAAE
jgi:hypothetical protein